MRKIKIRHFILFSLLSFCTASVSSLIVFYHYNLYIEDSNITRLRDSSHSIMTLLNLSDLEEIKLQGINKSEGYQDIYSKICVLSENQHFARIYVLYKNKDNHFQVLLDSQNKKTSWETFLIPIDNISPEALRAIAKNAPLITEPKRESRGVIQTIYTSLKDINGNRVGLLILDMDITPLVKERNTLLVILIFSLLLAFVIPLFLLRFLTPFLLSPLEEAEKKAGQSELRYRGLFEDTPISLWEEDFCQVKKYLDRLKEKNSVKNLEELSLIKKDVIQECAKRVNILEVNSATLQLMETHSKGALLGPLSLLLDEEHYDSFYEEIQSVWNGVYQVEKTIEIETLAGKKKNVLFRWFVPKEAREDFSRVIISLLDITEFKFLQNRLQQAQKMEDLGQLAGGVAHDFNNLVCGIMGYTDLCLNSIDSQEEVIGYLHSIMQASERAKKMVSKILTFSKVGGMEEQKILTLPPIIEEVCGLITASSSSGLTLNIKVDKNVHHIRGNSTSLHEIIMNLCFNGIQAMNSQGILSVSLRNYYSEEPIDGIMGEIQGGHFTVLEIDDQGKGMDHNVLNHIFEPFFSTKKELGGTGLGLAVVYGVIQSQKGNLQVESELGRGSIFRLFFPAVQVSL